MQSSIARFAVRGCGRSSFGQELMTNNEQPNAAVDQDTAIALSKHTLAVDVESDSEDSAAQVVAAITTREGRTASLAAAASAGESTPHYRYLLTSSFLACRLYIGSHTGSNSCMLPAVAQLSSR